MKYCSNKDTDQLIRKLVREGWVFKVGKKHGRLQAQSGSIVTVAKTPGDRRSFENFRRDLRRIMAQTINVAQ
jgi:hypothetical protein